MIDRQYLKGALTAAVIGGCAATAVAQVQDNSPSSFTLDRPIYARQDQAIDEGLLQSEMRSRGWGADTLDHYGLKLNGYIEVGWDWNTDDPPNGFMGVGRLFDDKSQDPRLDQVSIALSRKVLPSADRFDTGFMVQMIYGADVRYTQANGTNFYGSGFNNRQVPISPQNPHLLVIEPGQQDCENQFDIFQGNMSFNIPWQGGFLLTVGKFETPWGIERVEPLQNGLYSHSYMFGLSQPMTLTGAMAEYHFNEQWSFRGGGVIGWDQSLQDNNDFPALFVQASYKYDEDLSFVLTYMTGPEKPSNRSDWRQLLDLTARYRLGPEWDLAAEALMGYEDDVGTSIGPGGQRTFEFDDAAWYGAAIYSTYRLDDDGMFVIQARGEYFNDVQGARQLITEVWAATLGVNVVPFVNDRIGRNFVIRPEARYDWATDNTVWGEPGSSQVTVSVDAVFSF